MNPYDFVPLDAHYPPEQHSPVWHHTLKKAGNQDSRLYSGRLFVTITTETPLFIPDTETSVHDPDNPGEHIYNNAGTYIIPGSSLKGLLRSVVETLASGCLTMLSLPSGYDQRLIPPDFKRCEENHKLCRACRMFGMTPVGGGNAPVFLGKINIGDALVDKKSLAFYDPIYTAILEAPKPRHRAFYLDASARHIAGRKFYFHHHSKPQTVDRLLPIRNEPGTYRNQHIEPIDTGTDFETRIDFTNLEADEFAALLLAITLRPNMRHKVGYGKPLGLGSIKMTITKLCLIDYATRYATLHSDGGISTYISDELARLLLEQMAPLGNEICQFWQRFTAQPALAHLQTIWKWQPDDWVTYRYPSRSWFDAHPQGRIADTLKASDW